MPFRDEVVGGTMSLLYCQSCQEAAMWVSYFQINTLPHIRHHGMGLMPGACWSSLRLTGTIMALTGLTKTCRLEKERELEGIDTSNIVTGDRRARRTAAPINYAAIEAASSSDDDSSADDAQNGVAHNDANSDDSSDDQQESGAKDEDMHGETKKQACMAYLGLPLDLQGSDVKWCVRTKADAMHLHVSPTQVHYQANPACCHVNSFLPGRCAKLSLGGLYIWLGDSFYPLTCR